MALDWSTPLALVLRARKGVVVVRPPKRIVPSPTVEPESNEAPVQRRTVSKSRYMTSGPQPAAQQPVPPPRRKPTPPTVPHPERTVSPAAAPRATKFDARGSRGVTPPDESGATARGGLPPQPQYSTRGRRVVDLREGARRGADEDVTVDLTRSGGRMSGSARRVPPGAVPGQQPSQPPSSNRTFTKGRHMTVPTPPPPPVKPTPRRPDPAPPVPHPERSVAPPAAPRANKFEARGSGGGSVEDANETTQPLDTSGAPRYSVRGREIVDLREEARKAAEKAADVDLTDDSEDDERRETYYKRHSANLPYLGKE